MGFHLIGSTEKNFLRVGLISFWLLCSCVKTPDFSQDFGPVEPPEKILEALNSAPLPPVWEMKAGEFVFIEKYQVIENQNVLVYGQLAHEVIERTEQEETISWIIRTQRRELVDGKLVPTYFENEYVLEKSASPLSSLPVTTFSKSLATQAVPNPNISYHRLVIEDFEQSLPTLVKKRERCGGLAPEWCQRGLLPARRIQFDLVRWEKRGGERTRYLFVTSPHVPYLAGRLSVCAESVVDYRESRVKVTQCEVVRDFHFSQPPP